jgi:hypothetical protein
MRVVRISMAGAARWCIKSLSPKVGNGRGQYMGLSAPAVPAAVFQKSHAQRRHSAGGSSGLAGCELTQWDSELSG